MTYFLCFAIGVPGLVLGALFQDGGVFILGVIALGMALVGLLAGHEWRLYRHVDTVAHRPAGPRVGLATWDEDE